VPNTDTHTNTHRIQPLWLQHFTLWAIFLRLATSELRLHLASVSVHIWTFEKCMWKMPATDCICNCNQLETADRVVCTIQNIYALALSPLKYHVLLYFGDTNSLQLLHNFNINHIWILLYIFPLVILQIYCK